MTNVTLGMDLGDKNHEVCVINQNSEIVERFIVGNTRKQLRKVFEKYCGAVVAIETGTHSPWISRELEAIGCKVLVANARRLRMIYASSHKSDVKDAEMLARIARFDPQLLYPIHHRGKKKQIHLEQVKARDLLVRTRSTLISHVRGAVKSLGERLPSCSTAAFCKRAKESLPDALRDGMMPLLDQIETLTQTIRHYDQALAKLSKTAYPETACLRQIQGVGPVSALAFILTLDSAERFDCSRAVGAHLGLTPGKDQSGSSDKQLGITKEGNCYLRRLMVNCAQYILGRFGQDSDLRRHGERLLARGGKGAKRKAVVAVARKLSVLLHRLWLTGEVYHPLYNSPQAA